MWVGVILYMPVLSYQLSYKNHRQRSLPPCHQNNKLINERISQWRSSTNQRRRRSMIIIWNGILGIYFSSDAPSLFSASLTAFSCFFCGVVVLWMQLLAAASVSFWRHHHECGGGGVKRSSGEEKPSHRLLQCHYQHNMDRLDHSPSKQQQIMHFRINKPPKFNLGSYFISK